jgi:CHASE3 domain sensor protein
VVGNEATMKLAHYQSKFDEFQDKIRKIKKTMVDLPWEEEIISQFLANLERELDEIEDAIGSSKDVIISN